MDVLAIQFANPRRMGNERKCGVIDVGYRPANDIKEFSHEAETVRGDFKEGVDIAGDLNLT